MPISRPSWFRSLLVLALSATPMTVAAPACAQRPAHYRVIGYATDWNPVQDKDLHKFDTLIFAFAVVQDGRVVLTDAAAEKLQSLVALKQRDPGLKVDISV